ncbi:MAG: replication initiator protein A, partial [Pseudomonadota bacterium]
GHEISPWVEMTAHEVMVGCNWNTGKRDYQRFEAALDRLRGTTIKTNIKTGDQTVTRGFGLIDEYETWRIDENGEKGPFGRMSKVLVKLSDWTFRAVQSMEVLTIHAGYFRLRRPLERRFYEIARKHVGERNDPFRIGIDKLRNKVGTSMSLKHFRAEVKKIVAAGNIPQYGFMLIKDIITMQRLEQLSTNRSSQTLRTLRTDTRSKALAIASQIATSLISLEREWNSWVDKRNIKIESNDAHFMAFCQVKLQENSAYTPAISRNNGAQGVLALGDTEE